MLVFGNDQKMRGCFHKMVLDTQLGEGAYLETSDGERLPNGNPIDPLLVTNVSFGQKERVHLVECFQDVVHTYAFGHDPRSSLVSVSYVGFMVASTGTGPSDAFERFLSTYAANRISENQSYAKVLIGGSTIKGFMIGMSSATNDALHNLQNFSIDLLAVEVQEA